MKPKKPDNFQNGQPLSDQGSVSGGAIHSTYQYEPTRDAAANVIKAQIENIYNNSPTEDPNPYNKTHSSQTPPPSDYWQKYHSAWQDYYQRYYEGYYTHHLKRAKQNLEEQLKSKTEKPKSDMILSDAAFAEEEIHNLKQRLIGNVKEKSKKFRKSRHFIPLAAGLLVVLMVLFLQYNRVIISNVVAYVSPGSIDPQNIIVNPNEIITVSAEPRLIIPKINVDVPVIYDVPNDNNSLMTAMAKGVAHFSIPGASSHPGQIGNTVLSGHSSNDLFDNGEYKFIFAQLDKLIVGDTVYANYQSKRYTYTVTGKEIVNPNEVDKLTYATTKPILTLITCTPLGTAKYRLLVTAEQIKPNPSESTATPTVTDNSSEKLPGNSKTFFERLFGN